MFVYMTEMKKISIDPALTRTVETADGKNKQT